MYLKKVNIIVLIVLTVSFSLIAIAGADAPGKPTIISSSQGNFWVNYTWSPGVNTDSFNVSVNGNWTNGTIDTFKNTTSSPHGWVFIRVAGYNSAPSLSSFAEDHTQIKNNPIRLTDVRGSYFLYQGESLYIDANYSDLDNDKGTFATTATIATFDTSTGVLIWEPKAGDGREYTWSISVDDRNGSKEEQRFTVSRNSPITLTNVSDRYFFNEGDTLHIRPGYTDADNDNGIFATNAITQKKNVKFNSSSGELIWKTEKGDGGVYDWHINVTDGYGSISTQQFKVIIPLSISIQFKEPAIINDREQWIAARVGHIGKYIGAEATFKNTGEDSLDLIFTAIYNNTRTTFTNITIEPKKNDTFRHGFEINSSDLKNGLLDYTFEMEVNGFKEVWGLKYTTFNYLNTTNLSLPVIPLFKIKRSNADGVLVTEGSTTPPIIYTLEANSSVNLTDISIYDPFYPEKYFNISRLEVNNSKSVCWNNGSVVSCQQNYTYQPTTNDLSSNKCEEGYACIINLATFKGKYESGEKIGEEIKDTDYVEITVNRYPASDSNSGSRSSSSGSGGGGGGGGLAPTEDFNNLEKREVRELDVFFKLSAVYVFTSADPVKIVSFESSASQNQVPVAVEVLNNRSKHVEEDAPGNLYKYFNIFVGTSGFSKKVSKGIVFFTVNNSWLKNNDLDAGDIKLYKWNGSWVEKNIEIIESRDNSTYFASLIGNFSSFAIAGIKKPEVVKVSIDELNENSTQTLVNSSGKVVNEPGNINYIIWIIAIIGIASIIYYFKKIKLI